MRAVTIGNAVSEATGTGPAKNPPSATGSDGISHLTVGQLGRIEMRTRIVVADARTAPLSAHRLTEVLGAFSMLGGCTAPGCTTILFGEGTCAAHDPPRLHLDDPFLESADGSGAISNTRAFGDANAAAGDAR